MTVTIKDRYSDYNNWKYFDNVHHIEYAMTAFILIFEDGKSRIFEDDYFEIINIDDKTKV